MRWHDLLFIHWRLPADDVARVLPEGLRPDLFDGCAWVGLIPFTMTGVRILGLGLPTASRFHECNVRTYVTVAGEPGVYFFSLDAANALAVTGARLTWALPYHRARIDISREGDRFDYRVRRGDGAAAEIRWQVGQPLEAAPGSLHWFLTERYCLYVCHPRGNLRRGRIWHPRWRLRDAQLLHLRQTLLDSAGIRVTSDPHVVFASDGTAAKAWPLQHCS